VTRMKMTVFWNVASCSVIEIDRRFRGASCLHHKVILKLKIHYPVPKFGILGAFPPYSVCISILGMVLIVAVVAIGRDWLCV
jgi:hypothetical protein